MAEFQLPKDLSFNRGMIEDPSAYAKAHDGAAWLFLVGDEFASMPGGMSYAQVQEAVSHFARVISDPPRVLNLDLARQQVDALDQLPRPTLISCRSGQRASAVAYMYAGLRAGASADDVLAAAERDNAPFCAVPENKEWVRSSMEALRDTTVTSGIDAPPAPTDHPPHLGSDEYFLDEWPKPRLTPIKTGRALGELRFVDARRLEQRGCGRRS